MEPLTITREKVLEAASKCSTAKATLEVLFPECFEKKGLYGIDKHPYLGDSDAENMLVRNDALYLLLANANDEWNDIVIKTVMEKKDGIRSYYGFEVVNGKCYAKRVEY